MITITGTRRPIVTTEYTAVTLGKFDGIHRGHQLLIDRIIDWKKEGLASCVFTFDLSPVQLITGKPIEGLSTRSERSALLAARGVDYLIEYPFDEVTMHMEAERFVREVLVRDLHAKKIAVGEDFCFGYKRLGNADLLCALSAECGYEVEVIPKIRDLDRIISSSFIREELVRGRIENVNRLLGFRYSISGEVVHGNHIGHTLGFPTINVYPEEGKQLPPFGVYYTTTRIDGVLYPGVSNVGRKPTVSEKERTGIETHLFGTDADLYGKQVKTCFHHFARPERRFASFEELTAQVLSDRDDAKQYFYGNSDGIVTIF